jgi:hypothetical protein
MWDENQTRTTDTISDYGISIENWPARSIGVELLFCIIACYQALPKWSEWNVGPGSVR